MKSHWLKGKAYHLQLSEKAAEKYDSKYGTENFSTNLYMEYELRLIEDVIKQLGGSEKGTALDLGCGTAPLSIAATKRYKVVAGVDIAFRWLVVAKKRVAEMGRTTIPWRISWTAFSRTGRRQWMSTKRRRRRLGAQQAVQRRNLLGNLRLERIGTRQRLFAAADRLLRIALAQLTHRLAVQ